MLRKVVIPVLLAVLRYCRRLGEFINGVSLSLFFFLCFRFQHKRKSATYHEMYSICVSSTWCQFSSSFFFSCVFRLFVFFFLISFRICAALYYYHYCECLLNLTMFFFFFWFVYSPGCRAVAVVVVYCSSISSLCFAFPTFSLNSSVCTYSSSAEHGERKREKKENKKKGTRLCVCVCVCVCLRVFLAIPYKRLA